MCFDSVSKKRKKRKQHRYFWTRSDKSLSIYRNIAIGRRTQNRQRLVKQTQKLCRTCSRQAIIPDTTNIKICPYFSSGVRVEWSVSGGSKLRGSGSNNRAERRCGRFGGRARCRHVSNKNRFLARSTKKKKKRNNFKFEGQRKYAIVRRLKSLAIMNRKKKNEWNYSAIDKKKERKVIT